MTITVEDIGAVRVFTLCKARRRNALSRRESAEMATLIDRFEQDDAARVAILTGQGDRAFCAGGDLSDTDREAALPPTGFGGLTSRFDMAKPVIAAVNGLALGGGFELALACDIIVADEGAHFGLPEPSVGLAALAGGLQRLPRLIGEQAALGLILTADLIDAAEAYRLGLVYRIAPRGEVLREALAVAERIAGHSPAAIRASKQAVQAGLRYASLPHALAAQADLLAVRAMLEGPERREGIRAFREKRRPNWAMPPPENDEI
jgi:crotonobetainyl-CoA hydratase